MSQLRDFLSLSADLAGIISLIISIVTLVLASGIRKSMLRHIEKTDYLQDIDRQLTELQASYESLIDKDIPSDATSFTLLKSKLEVIPIRYEVILSKKVMQRVIALIDLVDKCKSNVSDVKTIQNCASQLHILILMLEKEKKLL